MLLNCVTQLLVTILTVNIFDGQILPGNRLDFLDCDLNFLNAFHACPCRLGVA